MTKTIIDEFLESMDPEEGLMYPTGYEDCILGVIESIGSGRKIVMSTKGIIQKLIDEGMTHEEAIEMFEYNIIGSYVGEGTPVYFTSVQDIVEGF